MRQRQNVAGALTLAAQREGVNPETATLSNDGNRAFAVQGQQPETQRYSQVSVNVSMHTPLVESSRQSVDLGQTQTPTAPQQNAPQQAAPQAEPNQDQAAPTRGAR